MTPTVTETRAYRLRLDNYEPPRAHLIVDVDVYDDPDAALVLHDPDRILWPDAGHAVFLLDDGVSVVAHYVAGWHNKNGDLFIKPFPLNEGTRPDTGEPVNMGNWMLGPQRAYHLKRVS